MTPARPPQEFHGSYTPGYLALHLYNDWSYTVNDCVLQLMNRERVNVVGFAAGHPVFATLRRIDIVFRIDPNRKKVAGRHAEEVVSYVEAEWDRRGVRDGVARIYWGFSTEWRDFDWENSDGVLELWNDEDCMRGSISPIGN